VVLVEPVAALLVQEEEAAVHQCSGKNYLAAVAEAHRLAVVVVEAHRLAKEAEVPGNIDSTTGGSNTT
jgi:hypothetical protein